MKNKRTPARRGSDFGPGTEPHTLVLKKKEAWKFEISAKSITQLLRRHKVIVVGVLAVVITGIVTRYVLVGFASTADFYPSSCLGNWENVQNALGKPDLPPGSSATDFTSLNSASLGTSTAQMFCGNFSGDTSIDTLTGKSFKEADLVVSWSFAFPPPAPVVQDATTGTESTGTVTGDASSSAATSSDSGISTTTIITPPTDASSGTSAPTTTVNTSTTDVTNSDSGQAAAADTSTPPTTPAPAVVPTPTPTTPDAGSGTDTTATPTQASPPPTSDPSTPAAPADTPTSWLHYLVGVAYADDTSTAIAATTTEIIDSSTIATATGTSYIQTGTSSVPTGTPIVMDTSAFQNIAVPSSTGDAVLSVVYSTDGVTWQPLVNVDSANWQQGRYPIPISSWAELQHLQIAFIGLGATGTPPVFLDAAGVEVSYVDAPQPQPDVNTTDTPTVDPDVAPVAPPPPPTPTELPPAQAFKQVFDPFAGQQCSVTPFSESVVAGGGGSFLLKLTPPAAATSTAKSGAVSAAHQPFLYDVSVGSLPVGVSATVVSEGPGMDTIGITSVSTVPPGSYNAVVVYNERQHDGSVAPNFCQFNLVVTPAST